VPSSAIRVARDDDFASKRRHGRQPRGASCAGDRGAPAVRYRLRSATPGSKAELRTFLAQIERGEVASVELRQKDNTAKIRLDNGSKYEVGFATDYGAELTERLLAAERSGKLVEFDVKPARSSVILSLLTYVLPFLIFIGFWIFVRAACHARDDRARAV